MTKNSRKRAHSATRDLSESQAKCLRLLAENASNSISLLNDCLPGNFIAYKELEQRGPPHLPTFRTSCSLSPTGMRELVRNSILPSALLEESICGFGEACNKKAAKQNAAEELVKLIRQHHKQNSQLEQAMLPRPGNHGGETTPPFSEEQPNQAVGDKAADALPGEEDIPAFPSEGQPDAVPSSPPTPPLLPQRSQEFANAVSQLVLNEFARIGKDAGVKYKVLAGIVMSQTCELEESAEDSSSASTTTQTPRICSFENSNKEKETLTLLCVTTGTKCLNGGALSPAGDAVHDCHAEVLARRCFIHFMLKEIARMENNSGFVSTILQPTDQPALTNALTMPIAYRLLPGVAFHLFISSAPCGDSRVFTVSSTGTDSALANERKCHGQLRSKIENGEGTIPTEGKNRFQTWDGVLGGERLLTMSCSDKLCAWNCFGFQGSLLTGLLEQPVFFSTLIIGELYHSQHATRALYQRVHTLAKFLPPDVLAAHYGPILPQLMCPTEEGATAGSGGGGEEIPKKSPDSCLNWIWKETSVEVINAPNGRPSQGMSRLSKRSLGQLYVRLLNQLGVKYLRIPFHLNESSYGYLKQGCSAPGYFITKNALHRFFYGMKYGVWVKKPCEVDYFKLPDMTQ